MGLFKKKEKIPELPSSRELPALPMPPEGPMSHELPAFPSDINDNINQELVKSVIYNPEGEKEADIEELPKDFSFGHEETGIPPVPRPMSRENIEKETETIFVRIDKFQKAQKDFEQIKKKVKEIESVLGKIRDVKSREDLEISSWGKDLEMIKSRLDEIDENIFNKI